LKDGYKRRSCEGPSFETKAVALRGDGFLLIEMRTEIWKRPTKGDM